MSQFFKALEQAERDRAREAEAEAEAATTDAASARPKAPMAVDSGGSVGVQADAVRPAAAKVPPAESSEPRRTERPAAERAAAEPAASGVSVGAPAPKPRAERPVVARKASVDEPPARTKPGRESGLPSPARVFRPSLSAPPRSRLFGWRAARTPLLVAQTDPTSLEADAYRTVRANIELMSHNGAGRHIAITSAAGGDGKSTTAANLAVVTAQAGRRVCLVDADLRRPTVHDIFGLPNVDGLAAALQHGKPLQAVAKAVDVEGLSVVVAGRGDEQTFHDLLTSQRLEKLIRDSEGSFDVVLFDSAPVVSADALNVAAVCGGVVLVVRAGSIPFSVLRRAVAQVTQVKGRVLGVLLNQADLRGTDLDSYRYYRGYHADRRS